MDIFDEVSRFAEDNHYVDVEDKIPVFLCSIGTHIFNGINKCGLSTENTKYRRQCEWNGVNALGVTRWIYSMK